MKRLLLLFILVSLFSVTRINAQSCFSVSAGPDIHTSCLNTCFNFKAKIPDVRTSESYKVVPIEYKPFPFTNPTGVVFNPAYEDDNYSDVIVLPFTFCFYGKTYGKCVVGTNGIVTFDVETNKNTYNAYIIDRPIFYAGGTPDGAGPYYPRASIMGPYHDIDPDDASTPQQPDRKMEYIIEGTAPCRKFILNFYKMPYYQCPGELVTQQMVLYEGTGIIDIFIESKPNACAASTNNGRSILGIQNWERDKETSVPGRNNTDWRANNEGWRFVPNGTTSLFSRVELYKNTIKIADGITTDLGTGELEVDFGSVCQSEDMSEYVVRAFYKKCDDPTIETEGSDTMIVLKTFDPVLANLTPASCPTATDGSITITDPVDPTVEYSIDNGVTWQTSPTFSNLAPGTYNVIAKIIGNTCNGRGSFVITSNAAPTVTTNIVPPNCPTTATGSITVATPAPGPGVEYSIDGGTTWQASPTFSGLAAGTYTINARINASGCSGTTTATVLDPGPIPIGVSITHAPCNGTITGLIRVTTPTGADFDYSLDGITWQSNPVFILPAGTYTVRVRRISTNCIYTSITYTINEPPVLSVSASDTKQTSCSNDDGEITITASGGVAPYSYSINNGASYQAGNVFSGLTVGNYNQIKVKDVNGCITNGNPVTITLNDTMRLELGPDTSFCEGSTIVLDPQTNDKTDIFSWSPSTGLSSTVIKNPVASPVDTIKYYLTAGWGLCQRKDSIIVNVKHKPTVYAGKDTAICTGTTAFLHGTVANLSGTVNYAWTPTTGLADPTAVNTNANPDTTTEYTLTVTDNYNCNFTVTDIIRVRVNPPVVAFAGNDTNAIYNRPHQMQATGGLSYTWTPAAPLNNPFISNPLATLKVDTYFTVTAKDDIGCADTDDIFIKVYDGPNYYLPNAFTPNGDGLNDIFRPIPVGIRSTEYFRVFNRYGQIMFETKEWMKGWDGTYKGKKQVSGTYVWTIKGIDKNGRVVEMQGTVILVQ